MNSVVCLRKVEHGHSCVMAKWMLLALLLISTRADHEETTSSPEPEDREVKIGVLLPMTGYWPIGRTSASAITIAVERINNDSTLLPGYNMTFLWNDSMCLAAEGLNQAVEFQIAHVDAIIGDGCDIICEPAAILAASWNLPMISWGCESSKLSEKTLFPTFARTVGSFSKMADLFLSVFSYFQWENIGILASTETIWQLSMVSLVKKFQAEEINVRYLQSFSPGSLLVTEREEYESMLALAKEKAHSMYFTCFGLSYLLTSFRHLKFFPYSYYPIAYDCYLFKRIFF